MQNSTNNGVGTLSLPDWLMPFQDADVRKLLDRRSALIGNEMGTGKTYEAIALDLIRRSAIPQTDMSFTPTLVVAPLTILQTTWQRKFEELAPDLKVITIDPKARVHFLHALRSQTHDVYILHWDVLRIIEADLTKVVWFHIIADEAHRAKNRKAQQTRSLKRLRTAWKSALTGTPVMNKPQDLWSILNWLYPEQWRGYWKFYNQFVDYYKIEPQGYHKIIGPKNERHLRQTIDPYFTRRTKEEVLPDLPDKYYTEIEVELYPKQRKVYDQMKKEMIAWLEHQDDVKPLAAPVVIAQLIRLQQFALAYADLEPSTSGTGSMNVVLTDPSSKIDALMQILEDNPNEPIVVFSQFKKAIDLVEDRLGRSGTEYVKITGDVSDTDRISAVDDFQSGRVNIFLGTIGAGSEGITLTRSRTVVFLDRDWTPARNAQAEDRLHRIGQKDAVQVIDIVAKRTVDQMRMRKLEMKKSWIRRMIDG